MPQFAVFRNPRGGEVPFLLQIQSNRLEHSSERVMMALRRRSASTPPDRPLTPHLEVDGERVFADPLNIATVRTSSLRELVQILPEADQDRIVRAIDEMISRA